MNDCRRTTIPAAEWRQQRQTHRDIVVPFTAAYRRRRGAGALHPIHDFLFTYYTLSSTKLERWMPGYGVSLEPADDALNSELLSDGRHVLTAEGIALAPSAVRPNHIKQLQSIRALCEAILSREPRYACFGMHEWAMTYRTPDIRHRYPFRISDDEVAAVVESIPYCCSHFDAYRFSSPAARGLNVLRPTAETRLQFEQGGCLHANMDLYKWAYKLIPLVPSDLLRDCFLLALETREIDMRATPYDFRSLGFAPIPIENEAGREEYRAAQQRIAEKAAPLRSKLLELTEWILSDLSSLQRATLGVDADPEHSRL